MENLLNYIIESGISLGVFTIIYLLLLRKETLLKVSRFYLLLALLFSTVLPFITIRYAFPVSVLNQQGSIQNGLNGTNLLETVTVFASGLPAKVGQKFLSFSPTLWFYKIGAVAAMVIIVTGLAQLLLMFISNRVFRLKRARLVLTRKSISPYSFFNLVFIGSELPRQENWKTMVHHELEHARQGHSFDVLFIDFMMVFQFFNPFYWIIRRLVRENHEYLADRAVLERYRISAGNYKALLLTQVIGGKPIITSNFFTIQTIKKRFKMITRNKTGKYGFLKYSAGLVVALVVTLLFACEKVENSVEPHFDPEKSLVFRDRVISIEEIGSQNLKEVMISRLDAQAIINELPQFKGILPDGEVMMLFDMGKSEDVELARKLKVFELTQKKTEIQGLPNDETVFVLVEDMPEYIGGEDALRQFLANNVKYPVQASENGIQGRVYVQFVVNENGMVENPRVVRGVDPLLDEEAVRVIASMPAWKPGKQKGKAVKVSYTAPINFKLQ